jgi:hypothetical protein
LVAAGKKEQRWPMGRYPYQRISGGDFMPPDSIIMLSFAPAGRAQVYHQGAWVW